MPASAMIHVRVPFVDVDSSNRIHYTAMMRYWELAEHGLMRAIKMPYASELLQQAFPRVHVEADFIGAIRFDDEIDIEARVGSVGRTSWTVLFTAWASGAGSDAPALAKGKMTIVSMDMATQRAVPLDERLRAALEG
ncbi:MAG TPA: hotdog domain-containing protein [Ktedonobacterales bacterium]